MILLLIQIDFIRCSFPGPSSQVVILACRCFTFRQAPLFVTTCSPLENRFTSVQIRSPRPKKSSVKSRWDEGKGAPMNPRPTLSPRTRNALPSSSRWPPHPPPRPAASWPASCPPLTVARWRPAPRVQDIRLPGKGIPNSHSARPVY